MRRQRALDAPGRSQAVVALVVNVDWFFLSHRLPIALEAQRLGARVVVIAGETGQGHLIREHGLPYLPLPLVREGRTLRSEARTLRALLAFYRKLRPDLVHHVTLQPVLYGSIAALLASRRSGVVNALAGLGYAFSSEANQVGFERAVKHVLPRVLSRTRSIAILQNESDRDTFVKRGLLRPDKAVLIRGSGVDLDTFAPAPLPPGPPTVLFASRMLWSKGVGDFVEAAAQVKQRSKATRFVLAGESDENPESVSSAHLREWQQDGVVEWLGRVNDMPRLMRESSLVVLPTYYPEGVPKVLLEAAASGRAIVASDTPGCREIVRDGHNGVLVPPRNPDALARAISALLESPSTLAQYGLNGRELAVREFGIDRVVSDTMEVYRRLLPEFPYVRRGSGA